MVLPICYTESSKGVRKMYELTDREWVKNRQGQNGPTQLSAVRVDADWNTVDTFSALLCPKSSELAQWEHINLVSTPGDAQHYHVQPRLFLSLRDTFAYIIKHDRQLSAGTEQYREARL